MFGLGEKDKDGRQKRIGHSGRFIRASRTGGVAARISKKVGGVTATANTRHGVRFSTRVAKGVNVALQNGNFRLRGRWNAGPLAFNMSKGGFSTSLKTGTGRINLTKPQYSSFKFAGFQVRGKKAVELNLIAFAIGAVFSMIGLAFAVLVWVLGILLWIASLVFSLWLLAGSLLAIALDVLITIGLAAVGREYDEGTEPEERLLSQILSFGLLTALTAWLVMISGQSALGQVQAHLQERETAAAAEGAESGSADLDVEAVLACWVLVDRDIVAPGGVGKIATLEALGAAAARRGSAELFDEASFMALEAAIIAEVAQPAARDEWQRYCVWAIQQAGVEAAP